MVNIYGIDGKLLLQDKPINPNFCFRLTRVLSILAPHFYTEKQLAEIEEIEKAKLRQAKLLQESSSFGSTSQHMTMEEMSPPLKNKKRHCPSDEGEEDDISYKKKKEIKSRKKKSKKNEPALLSLPLSEMPIEVSNRIQTCEKKKEVKSTKKKSKKIEPTLPLLSLPPPEMPIEVSNRIQTLHGRDINYVMCKKLFNSDLTKNLNRISMPFKSIQSNFLTEEEKAILNTKEYGNPGSFEVAVLDPSFREFEMDFKKWEMNSTCIYNITKSFDLVDANKLQKGEEFHIWSFRVDGKLYLLMNKKNP